MVNKIPHYVLQIISQFTCSKMCKAKSKNDKSIKNTKNLEYQKIKKQQVLF